MKIFKFFVVILIVLLPFLTFSQERSSITGLMGIEFGASKEKVIALMKAKGYNQKLPIQKNMTFDKVKFGAFSDCTIIFAFVNNKLCQGAIILPTVIEGKLIDQYEDINAGLSEKYGKGKSYASFKYPYEKGDGHELTAIKLGKAEYNTFWSDEKGDINTYISSNMLVVIKYQDPILIEEAIKEQNKANASDY